VELLFVDAACLMKRRDSEIFNSAAKRRKPNSSKKKANQCPPALWIRRAALDTAVNSPSYAPRDPKEAEQLGLKVVVVGIPRPPRKAIERICYFLRNSSD
jgi:hypothetical protein